MEIGKLCLELQQFALFTNDSAAYFRQQNKNSIQNGFTENTTDQYRNVSARGKGFGYSQEFKNSAHNF
jgi:hypothetical protein